MRVWYIRFDELLYKTRLQTFVGPPDVATDALHVCRVAFSFADL